MTVFRSAPWSSLLGINNWFSWENQYGGIAVADIGQRPHLVVVAVDNPPGANTGFHTIVPLTEDPRVHGSWELLPFDSQVLPIHAAVLRTGEVLFFAGSGNNTARATDPDFGDVTKGLWTTVVWDPTAAIGGNFFHPDTIRRANGRPLDFFCCGHTFLPDGSVVSAGGNLNYNYGNNLGLPRCRIVRSPDAAVEPLCADGSRPVVPNAPRARRRPRPRREREERHRRGPQPSVRGVRPRP